MLKHSLAIATCLAFSSSVMGNEANLLYTNTMQFPYKHNADGYMVFDIHGKLVVPPEGHFDTLNYMAERWLAFSGENLYIYDESGKLIIKRTGQDPVYLGGDLLSIRVDTGKRILIKESANKQVISSQADSLIKISRIWADFFPANTSNQPI